MDRESLARLICESIERHPVNGQSDPTWERSPGNVVYMTSGYVDLLAVADDLLAAMKPDALAGAASELAAAYVEERNTAYVWGSPDVWNAAMRLSEATENYERMLAAAKQENP